MGDEDEFTNPLWKLPKIEQQHCDKCGAILGDVKIGPNGERIICGNCGWSARPRRGPQPEFKKTSPSPH